MAAVELARASSPDLVLQDLFLPDMDGYELFKRLRSVSAERFGCGSMATRETGRNLGGLSA
jgi:CheY-like chemotaxis protein